MLNVFRSLVVAVIVLAGALFIVPASRALADTAQNEVCQGISGTVSANGDCTSNNGSSSSLDDIIKAVIKILSGVVAIAAVIVMIYAAFQIVTAQGDSGKVSNARSTILYALIALAIATLAQAIVTFVLHDFTTTSTSTTPKK